MVFDRFFNDSSGRRLSASPTHKISSQAFKAMYYETVFLPSLVSCHSVFHYLTKRLIGNACIILECLRTSSVTILMTVHAQCHFVVDTGIICGCNLVSL